MKQPDLLQFLITNWMLLAVILTSGMMLITPALMRGRGGAQLTTLQATQMINQKDAVIIDVRDAGDFAKKHIAGARSMPEKGLEERKSELQKIKGPIIVACQRGERAGSAANKIKALGLTEVYVLSGGQVAWEQAGLPTKKS
jgi:rhodanese-related sulfurtransferase